MTAGITVGGQTLRTGRRWNVLYTHEKIALLPAQIAGGSVLSQGVFFISIGMIPLSAQVAGNGM